MKSSTPSHTPSPWEAVSHEIGGSERWFVQFGAGNVATVCSLNSACLLYNNAENDARLIAAAPELLEALTRIVQLNDEMPEEHPARLSHGECAQACAAIKKARGT